MDILGIETSCDETAASVVKNGKEVLSNVVTSSLKQHQEFGGIIPEIASRHQLELITSVVKQSLSDAHLTLKDIDAIAVTARPGLIGSLLVGISFARALSFSTRKLLIEVDHIKAHLYANFLTFPSGNAKSNGNLLPKLPAIGLVVSGGHSSLYHVRAFNDFHLLGQTRDDAAGEAFDKVARLLGLGYPGGPIIDRLAQKGENTEIRFSCADLPGSNDFSFSGIKTAVLYYKNKHSQKKNFSVNKVAYSFQKSVVSVLVEKSISLCKKRKVRTLLIGGGVAANSSLRTELMAASQKEDVQVFFPSFALCMDNAAMIAGLGYQMISKRK